MAGETILIADDDQGIRTVLQGALAREGFDVRVTSNASTLWNWISAGDGKLVITDVVLPDESGLDLIPKIKKIRPNLQVVVMSAQNTVLTALRASQRGAFDYLPKPFDLVELTNIVKKALSFDNSNYTNKKDIEEIKKVYLRGIKFIYVKNMFEVINYSITNRKVPNSKFFKL